MNDHQGSWWVLIVVTHTHRLLAAKSGRSASRPHYHKAVLSPVALTFELRPWPVRAVVSATNYLGGVLNETKASYLYSGLETPYTKYQSSHRCQLTAQSRAQPAHTFQKKTLLGFHEILDFSSSCRTSAAPEIEIGYKRTTCFLRTQILAACRIWQRPASG